MDERLVRNTLRFTKINNAPLRRTLQRECDITLYRTLLRHPVIN